MPRSKSKTAQNDRTRTDRAAVLGADAFLRDIMAALPHPVMLVTASAPHEILWRNEAAQAAIKHDQLGQTGGGAGGIISQMIETVMHQQSAATIHDHDFFGQRCARINMTALPAYNACLVTLTPHSTLAVDITDEAQGALRSAGLMARMLAHELKNPLSGIQAAGQLLQKSASDAAAKDLAGLVVGEAARIGRLIDRVAVFDDENGHELQESAVPVNIHAPLEQGLSVLKTTHPQVTLVRGFDPSLPDLIGHHDQLVQIFDNLLRNAAEAGASRIDISTFYRHSDAPIDARHQQRLPLTVQITDNGGGMDAQTRQRLFEPYYTTKARGQGLGLPIVAKLVADHGGRVDVHSGDGKTIFTLSFPYHRRFAETEIAQ